MFVGLCYIVYWEEFDFIVFITAFQILQAAVIPPLSLLEATSAPPMTPYRFSRPFISVIQIYLSHKLVSLKLQLYHTEVTFKFVTCFSACVSSQTVFQIVETLCLLELYVPGS